MTETIVLGFALSLALAGLISEGWLYKHLTGRGRIVIPLLLGIGAWLLWATLALLGRWLRG